SLLEKLEASAGLPVDQPPIASALEMRLRQRDELFRQRMHVTFDDSASQPTIGYSVIEKAEGTPPIAMIALAGRVPSGARTFSWTYGWTFATYALTVRIG